MTEFEILSHIHTNGNIIEYKDLAYASLSSTSPDMLSDSLRLRYLINEGFLDGDPTPGNKINLTDKGVIRLDELSKERAERRKQRAFEVFLAIISALVGAILSQPLWNWIG